MHILLQSADPPREVPFKHRALREPPEKEIGVWSMCHMRCEGSLPQGGFVASFTLLLRKICLILRRSHFFVASSSKIFILHTKDVYNSTSAAGCEPMPSSELTLTTSLRPILWPRTQNLQEFIVPAPQVVSDSASRTTTKLYLVRTK